MESSVISTSDRSLTFVKSTTASDTIMQPHSAEQFHFVSGFDKSYAKEKRAFVLKRHFRKKKEKCQQSEVCMKIPDIVRPPTSQLSTREQRGWQFFREQTASRIEMSHQEIFQLGETHLSIRHLLISLGGMYESWDAGFKNLESSRRTDAPMRFGLQQCNKAINILTRASSLSIGVVLTSCLLFASFQNSQNHCETAFRHFESGLKILQRYKLSERSPEDEFIQNYLEPAFSSHRSKPTTGRASNPAVKAYEQVRCRMDKFALPNEFKDTRSARNLLYILMDLAVTAIEAILSSNQTTDQILNHSQKLLQQWRDIFERYKTRVEFTKLIAVQDPSFPEQNMRLHIHHRVCCIVLSTIPFDDEMLFDAHLQNFRDIVAISHQYIQQDEVEMPGFMPCFSFNSGLMMPLFLVACRCRDPHTRRKAVKILSEIRNLKEGFWESHILATCAERVIAMEEHDYNYNGQSTKLDDISGTTVAAEDRIRLTSIVFDPGIVMVETPETTSALTSDSFGSSAVLSAVSPTAQLIGSPTISNLPSPQFSIKSQPHYILNFTRPASNPIYQDTTSIAVPDKPAMTDDEIPRAPWRVTFIVEQANTYIWERYFGKLEYFSFYDQPVARVEDTAEYLSFKECDGEWIYMGESVQSSWWHSIEDKI